MFVHRLHAEVQIVAKDQAARSALQIRAELHDVASGEPAAPAQTVRSARLAYLCSAYLTIAVCTRLTALTCQLVDRSAKPRLQDTSPELYKLSPSGGACLTHSMKFAPMNVCQPVGSPQAARQLLVRASCSEQGMCC